MRAVRRVPHGQRPLAEKDLLTDSLKEASPRSQSILEDCIRSLPGGKADPHLNGFCVILLSLFEFTDLTVRIICAIIIKLVRCFVSSLHLATLELLLINSKLVRARSAGRAAIRFMVLEVESELHNFLEPGQSA